MVQITDVKSRDRTLTRLLLTAPICRHRFYQYGAMPDVFILILPEKEMYRQSRAVGTVLVAVACAACSKAAPGPVVALTPAEAIWTGQIQPTEQNSGGVEASRRTMIDGRVEMQADKDYPTRTTVSYTHLRAHETGRNLVCRL